MINVMYDRVNNRTEPAGYSEDESAIVGTKRKENAQKGENKKQDIEVYKLTASLQEITYHMGSHCVTYHPAEVTFSPLPQPKLVLDLATEKGCKAELT